MASKSGTLTWTQPPGPTCSQHLFSLTTRIDPCSFIISGDTKFFLFMNMHAEFKWVSHKMTPKAWVLATEEYSQHLKKKQGQGMITKNPQVLLQKLCDMEPKLMER
ncbi:hypothetical protein PAXRUDRAFT_20199 [Paxillus rubicundulus Ve08.2h10]|uniref:Uncharacterized protein n=1 Tax=Paxillus rubicundulus Ve08.2h10 TaxID=930991 RepID=A0A0D0D2I2_9AGAM|nr:hypothetical protein PAXRUDRAFT_20199 [Paxillus rubicundulus Ve08.2h10]